MTPEEIRWLTWGAIHHRPHGAPRWDEPGTAKAITDHCGSWQLDVATQHVLAHARDPKAKTPFAIKGNAPHTEPQRTPRHPPRAGADQECRAHLGEYVDSCRGCASDQLALVDDPAPDPPDLDGLTGRERFRIARDELDLRHALTPTTEEAADA